MQVDGLKAADRNGSQQTIHPSQGELADRRLSERRAPVAGGGRHGPAGEIGLIFAGVGLASGVIAEGLYSALIVVAMLTTFAAPPWLKALYRE